MPVSPIHAKSIKGRLVEAENAREILVFHYNPTVTEFDIPVEYGDIDVPGFPGKNPEYSQTGAKRWRFTLFLNEWAQNFPIQRSVEDTIRWLEERTAPRRQTSNPTNFEEQPPTLLLVIGDLIEKVVIEQMRVRITMRRPVVERFNARQNARQNRQQILDVIGSVFERAVNVDLTIGKTVPKEGSAMRAEVELVLRRIFTPRGFVIEGFVSTDA